MIDYTLSDTPDVDLFGGFWYPLGAYLFRREIVAAAGPWKMSLPVIQDARFALDCALVGGVFHRCDGVMASYRIHKSGSVSTGSRAKFLRDCLVNAEDVCEWWQRRGVLDDRRRHAVADVGNQVARGSVGVDEELFDRACALISSVLPQYLHGCA